MNKKYAAMSNVTVHGNLNRDAVREVTEKIKAGIDLEKTKRVIHERLGMEANEGIDLQEMQAVVREGQLAFRCRMTVRSDIVMILDCHGNYMKAFQEKLKSDIAFPGPELKIISHKAIMYLNYYELNKYPFKTNPDPEFLWLGEKHKEALSLLKYGILKQDGFLLLTGEVGTGKTSIIKYLIKANCASELIATINDPAMPVIDFYNFLSEEFKLNKKFFNKADFLIEFRKFLLRAYSEHKPVFVIIDEAQRLNHEGFEEIRLLSNIELDDQKLVNIFFVGQMEIETKLMDPKNKAIAQRITMSYNIQPLDESETKKYIIHRLQIAGAKRGIFTTDACKQIFAVSHGIPRLINSICDCALLTAYSKDWKVVDSKTIKECQIDLRIPIGTIAKKKEQP